MPGIPQELLAGMSDKEGANKIKKFMCIIDSMNEVEVGSDGKIFYDQPNRIRRVARGSGGSVRDVEELLAQHGMFAGMVKKMGGSKGMMNQMKKASQGRGAPVNPMAQMSRILPQGMLDQIGGMGGMQNMMEQMGLTGANGMPDMGRMQEMMQSMGMGGMMPPGMGRGAQPRRGRR